MRRILLLVIAFLYVCPIFAKPPTSKLQLISARYDRQEYTIAQKLIDELLRETLTDHTTSQVAYYQSLIHVRNNDFRSAYDALSRCRYTHLDLGQKVQTRIAVDYISRYGNLSKRKIKRLERQFKIDTRTSPWHLDFKAFYEYHDGIARDEFKNPNVPPAREARFRTRTSVKATYKAKINTRNAWDITGEGRSIIYETERSDLDITSYRLDTSWQHALSTSLSLEQEYQYNHFSVGRSMDTFLQVHQFESAMNYKPTSHQLVRVAGRIKFQNLTNDMLDGETYTLMTFAIHQINDYNIDVIVGCQYEISKAVESRFSYDQQLFLLGLKKTFWSDANLRLNASYVMSDFEGKFNLNGEAYRKDDKWSVTARFTYPVGDFDVEAFANHTSRSSTIHLYEYDSSMYGIGLTWKY